jgi:hypothetical protein
VGDPNAVVGETEMRRIVFVSVFVAVFALGGSTALANDNNNNRIGRADPPSTPDGAADGVPCHGMYQAGVGNPPGSGGATVGTPGFDHVFENDEEMCHGRED